MKNASPSLARSPISSSGAPTAATAFSVASEDFAGARSASPTGRRKGMTAATNRKDTPLAA